MLAQINKVENKYIATFIRHWDYSVGEVWSWLTENDKLEKWFSELEIDDLSEGGIIKFDMQDGTFEEMKITNLKVFSVLEFTWGEDLVRFELEEKNNGCRLLLIEEINKVSMHTPKDLAGWHVCLDVIHALLNSESICRQPEWEKWYEQYAKLF
ncbi:SRPBCC family protein [Bacillus sp. Marseille-P3661]|uniref:SRPBCC family protein n=1 Tax=Bacillus sp. Marseille-P3661 TaxID=1936234 RepID=UPI000C829FB3|nr:SRPBCC family protein [Bacillus sp. Marseille-P3661]